MHFTQRRLKPEKMDDPDVDRSELGCALEYLAKSNRCLGGTRLILKLFEKFSQDWEPGETINVLDIGTGSADFPVALCEWATNMGFNLHITAVDLHPLTLEFARERIGTQNGIELVEANALKLMDHFKPNSFDYVHAGLFLHHLQDMEVLTMLRIMQRLSSRMVIWNDLVRSWLTKLAIKPFAMTGPPIFRHDAIASMHAGFTRSEAIDLAKRVGLEKVTYRQHLFHRFVLTSEKM